MINLCSVWDQSCSFRNGRYWIAQKSNAYQDSDSKRREWWIWLTRISICPLTWIVYQNLIGCNQLVVRYFPIRVQTVLVLFSVLIINRDRQQFVFHINGKELCFRDSEGSVASDWLLESSLIILHNEHVTTLVPAWSFAVLDYLCSEDIRAPLYRGSTNLRVRQPKKTLFSRSAAPCAPVWPLYMFSSTRYDQYYLIEFLWNSSNITHVSGLSVG